MSRFGEDLRRFVTKVTTTQHEQFVGVVDLAFTSIVEGSPVTGAPGQPVDTGTLKSSWQKTFPSRDTGEITTNVVYAPGIENAVGPHGPITLRSPVGGFHSVALTVARMDKIAEHVARVRSGTETGPITAQTGYTGEDGG